MIRIEISAAAYMRRSAGACPSVAVCRPKKAPTGGFYLWLDKATLNRLRAAREPGEGFGETILRLASETCY